MHLKQNKQQTTTKWRKSMQKIIQKKDKPVADIEAETKAMKGCLGDLALYELLRRVKPGEMKISYALANNIRDKQISDIYRGWAKSMEG